MQSMHILGVSNNFHYFFRNHLLFHGNQRKSEINVYELILYVYAQGSHCYREKIWSGISSALEIGNTQMDQEQIVQPNLGTGKPQGKTVR